MLGVFGHGTVERGIPGPAEEAGRLVDQRELLGLGAVQAAEELPIGLFASPGHPERLRLVPEAVDRLLLGGPKASGGRVRSRPTVAPIINSAAAIPVISEIWAFQSSQAKGGRKCTVQDPSSSWWTS